MKRIITIIVLTFLTATYCLAWPATNKTDSVSLAWDPNPATVSSGFILYWGTNSGNYTGWTNVNYVTNFTLRGLSPGTTYYFAVTSYDTNQVESDFSNEVNCALPARPKPPTIRVTGVLQASCGDPLGPWQDVAQLAEFTQEADEPRFLRTIMNIEIVP